MTAARPANRPNDWFVRKDSNGNIIEALNELGNCDFIVYKSFVKGKWCVSVHLPSKVAALEATTAEQAITEAVVAIAQHLSRLSAELDSIPITLPK